MHKRGKPFVLYRRGPMSFSIVPRGWRGWAQLAAWIALLLPLVLWFLDHTRTTHHETSDPHAGLLFLLGVAIWLVAGLWWMVARAEVVEWAEILRERQRAEQSRRRSQR